ncbi:MAG: glutamate mutase L [Anaerolineae bacterium]|nr:glutamate mutase L [Anaerolineae bacterium]
MAEETTINSLLIADIGSVHTRLVLLDLVEGQYRLVASSRARTTAQPPLSSVSRGLEHAAERMTEMIGRRLLSPEPDQAFFIPETGGHGVDAFLATGSAGRPMRVFVVGLTPEISLTSARHVLAGTYVTVTDSLNPDDLRSREELVNTILRDEPDLIFIVGGTDGGAEDILIEQVETVRAALSLVTRGKMPTVLFAGNRELRRRVDAMLGSLTTVFAAKNIRPSLQEENLFPAQIELAMVYDDYRSSSPGGFAAGGRQSRIGVIPTTQGYMSAIRYLSELPEPGIGPLCVDVGSANSLLMAGVNHEPRFTIRTDLGVGHNAVQALAHITPASLQRWLPFDSSPADLRDYAWNKQLYPGTMPVTDEDLMIEQAFAREIIRLLVADARPDWGLGHGSLLPHFDPIIAAGAILTEAQHPGISAMLLLDALQPAGITRLRLDPHNLLSALGVAAYLDPVIMVQALESGGIVNLGTAFCPLGSVRDGSDALYVQIRLADGRVINHTVKGGEIWMAPTVPGLQARVTVKMRRGLSIQGKRRLSATVMTGTAGIIFDARGRPLVMPRTKTRAARFLQWQYAMSGRELSLSPKPQEDIQLPSLDDVDDLFPDLDSGFEPFSDFDGGFEQQEPV